MASTTPHTIVLRSNTPDNLKQRTRNAVAAAAVTPGMLCELTTAGKVQAHSAAAGVTKGRLVALENYWSNHGSGPAIDHAYAADETVEYLHALPGDELYMLVAASQSIAMGDPLVSNGDGYLKEVIPDATLLADAIVGYAAAAVTTTTGTARVKVTIA